MGRCVELLGNFYAICVYGLKPTQEFFSLSLACWRITFHIIPQLFTPMVSKQPRGFFFSFFRLLAHRFSHIQQLFAPMGFNPIHGNMPLFSTFSRFGIFIRFPFSIFHILHSWASFRLGHSAGILLEVRGHPISANERNTCPSARPTLIQP